MRYIQLKITSIVHFLLKNEILNNGSYDLSNASNALLSSNLPSVIDRSNLSPSRGNDPTSPKGTQKTDKRTDSRNGDSWKKQLQPVELESVALYWLIMHCSCPLT